MNIHDYACPRQHCQRGYIRSAVFDSDTNKWMPTDYICDWVPSDKIIVEFQRETDARLDEWESAQ